MKKTILSLKVVILVLIATVTMQSCKKYDEGPALSLRSKTSRVVNNWKVKSAKTGTTDFTQLYANTTIEFKKDGTYSFTSSGNQSNKGKWEFDSKKEHILMTDEGSSSADKMKIIKLKEKEMILEQTENNLTSTLVLEPK